MDLQTELFEILGVRVTWASLLVGLFGAIPTLVALYKLTDAWRHRHERRMQMLRTYLAQEERDISSKRKDILRAINLATQSYLSDREFDVGQELDVAVVDLDNGHPEQAAARLMELEKRLERNESLLRKRADDLARHRASVHIFIAALADQSRNTQLGLHHIAEALRYDRWDLDALKYQSILLLTKGDYAQAEQGFDRLRLNANGASNANYRADAYLGLASVDMQSSMPEHQQALSRLGNALQNLNSLPAAEQDSFTRAQIHRLRGQIFADNTWPGADTELAREAYEKALIALNQITRQRAKVDIEIVELERELGKLAKKNSPLGKTPGPLIN